VSDRLKLISLVAAGVFAASGSASAADIASTFSGNVLGSVVDALDNPQMGASVLLYDRYQRLIRKTLTTPDGRFGFGSLPPALYSIKVLAPALVPALRDKIAVRAGLSSVLEIRMATLFSSVELQYTTPTTAMSEDWKWVLRASSATRAITRAVPTLSQGKSSSKEDPGKIFTDTQGLVSLSAGDAGSLLSDVSTSDLGTSFALRTTFYDRNQLTVSGAFGQSMRSGMPTMGVRATYSRTNQDGIARMPEVTLMVREVALPLRLNLGGTPGMQSVRAATLSYYDTMDILDRVHLEYGSSAESISYFDRVSRVSPFARATVSLGAAGSLAASYSSGGAPNDLYIHQFGDETDLAGTVNALSSLPKFSLRGGRLAMQRTKSYEAGYSKAAGSRTCAVSAFYEDVQDGRLNFTGDLTGVDAANVLPDVSTTTSIYNLGRYNRHGLVASLDQKFGDNLQITAAAGAMGGFTDTGEPNQDPAMSLRRADHPIASVGATGTLPKLSTRLIGNYEFVGGDAIVPRHIFTTQRLYAEPGLNLLVRQPIPSLFGVGKLELSTDLRNLLAQGYVPSSIGDGRRVLLIQAPRAVRGGLNIIF
jgi:hypothetical protein